MPYETMVLKRWRGRHKGHKYNPIRDGYFNPKTMRFSKADPRVIYDRTRIHDRSCRVEGGYILIGTKGNPSRQEMNDTLMHERCHSPHHIAQGKTGLDDAKEELRAFACEKRHSSPKRWNRILPTRTSDFGASLSWLTKKQKRQIRPKVIDTLAPKSGGGNPEAIKKAHKKLQRDW